jgi:hypothetical protein
LLKNSDAQELSYDNPLTQKIIRLMKTRIKSALVGDKTETKLLMKECEEHLVKLIDEWTNEVEVTINLRYQAKDKSAESLLVSFDDSKTKTGLWETLNSMRNVEKTGLFEVDGGLAF